MRHRKNTVKLGRQTSHYKATVKHLACSLIKNKTITTTKTKAKVSSRLAEKLVTMAKQDSVANRRKAYSVLQDRGLVSILFRDIAPLFKERNGGYTRVILTSRRKGDNAQLAILEFVEKPVVESKKEKKKEKKAKLPSKAEDKADIKEKKEETKPKKVSEPPREPVKPAKPARIPEKKPGFFKRIFGKKQDR
ncbi:MAG: 50S ribosomal protein L17 [Candidatus Omnitrophota bacterium]